MMSAGDAARPAKPAKRKSRFSAWLQRYFLKPVFGYDPATFGEWQPATYTERE